MTDKPLISVLMPVRNEEHFVVAAVRSVLEQDSDVEVLVIDGESTDRTVDMVTAMGDPRVRLLGNPQRTIPHALNVGLKHVRGEYIARVDAHATISDSYLRSGLAVLDGDPAVAGVGGMKVGVAQTSTGKAIGCALSSPFGVGNAINHYSTVPQDTDHASFGVYRTSVARAVGGWDESLPANEDVDFDHRILLAGHRLRYEPSMRIDWYVRETLPEFGRQYRRYGRGKGAMVLKNGPSAIRLRHLAAPALVGWLGLAAVLALLGRRKTAAAMVAPYAAGIAGATHYTERQLDPVDRVEPTLLARAFVTMHLAWGVGFLEGVVLRKPPAHGSAKDVR
jgi:succinoglycan biosynthesis protein ExoA